MVFIFFKIQWAHNSAVTSSYKVVLRACSGYQQALVFRAARTSVGAFVRAARTSVGAFVRAGRLS